MPIALWYLRREDVDLLLLWALLKSRRAAPRGLVQAGVRYKTLTPLRALLEYCELHLQLVCASPYHAPAMRANVKESACDNPKFCG